MIWKIGMPNLGHTMERGKLVDWLKRRGDSVAAGEPLAVVETDKVTVEIEAPAAGTLLEVLAEAETVVPVGETMALLGSPAEAAEAARMAAQLARPRAEARPAGDASASPARRVAADASRADAGRTSPLARSRARELGVDLSGLEGSGPDGLITRGDVERAAVARSAGPATLASERIGAAGPTVVFLHGFAADRSVWGPLRQRLGGASVAFDLPGHGASPPADEPGAPGIARLLSASLADVPGPLHLVGHSLGAAVCLAAAEALGARLASLTLIAPFGFGPSVSAPFVEAPMSGSDPADTERALAHLVAPGRRVARAMIAQMDAQLADPGRRSMLAAVAQANFPNGRQAWAGHDALARVACPVQAIWGRADRVIPARHAEALPDTVDLHLLADAGHLVLFEAAPTVAGLIAAFIERTRPGDTA